MAAAGVEGGGLGSIRLAVSGLRCAAAFPGSLYRRFPSLSRAHGTRCAVHTRRTVLRTLQQRNTPIASTYYVVCSCDDSVVRLVEWSWRVGAGGR